METKNKETKIIFRILDIHVELGKKKATRTLTIQKSPSEGETSTRSIELGDDVSQVSICINEHE